MTRKKRMFEIDMPDEAMDAGHDAAEGNTKKRGPMASAIVENAEALQARRSAADAIREENDALAHEYAELKNSGQIIEAIPLEDIHSVMLVRDRLDGEDAELEELVKSINDIGLSNPIRVLPRPNGDGYELVQGYRRLSAYKLLHKRDGQGGWAKIPSLILAGETDIAGLYRRMVDENIVRKDLSFAEMAHAAKTFADDPDTGVSDLGEAIADLFQSAPYSKRSYIRSFASMLETLGDVIKYPTAIPRALGVSLSRALRDRSELADEIRQELARVPNRTAAVEMAFLNRSISETEVDAPSSGNGKPRAKSAKTKTTFHIQSDAGQVKCTAGNGRLEIKVDRDFSSIDRSRLERAIADLVEGLG